MSGAIQTQTTQIVYPPYTQPLLAMAPAASPPLMPEPQSELAGGDPMSMIYELMSKQRNNDMSSGKADVDHNREAAKAAMVKQAADFKKQEDAENSAKAWGIFGKIASCVAIAVSAVAAACSCGAASGLCVAACVLSTLAFAEGEAHVLTTVTGNPDADKAFQMGCGIGAALCSGGAGFASLAANAVAGGAQIASAACKITQEVVSNCATGQTAQYVSMAFGIGSAVASLGGGVASATGFGSAATAGADATKVAAQSISTVANVSGGANVVMQAAGDAVDTANHVSGVVSSVNDFVKAGGEITAGVGAIGVGMYQADATDRAADAKQEAMQIDQLQQLASWMIDGIQATDDSHKQALQTLQGAMQTQAQTLVVASAKV